ncbi:MAG: hypothetical protein NY202_04385 [Mollicutes bacterium UO1]
MLDFLDNLQYGRGEKTDTAIYEGKINMTNKTIASSTIEEITTKRI